MVLSAGAADRLDLSFADLLIGTGFRFPGVTFNGAGAAWALPVPARPITISPAAAAAALTLVARDDRRMFISSPPAHHAHENARYGSTGRLGKENRDTT